MLLPTVALASCTNENGMSVCKAIDYVGDGNSGHKMDLYLPSAGGSNLAVVVWIEGTAFAGLPYERLHSADYPCKQLTDLGMACAHIAYPSGSWPGQHQATRAAVKWLRGEGKKGSHGLGGKIGVHGASSGGNLAAFMWSSGHLEDETFGSEFARIGQYASESAAVSAAAIYWPEYHLDPDDEPACDFSAKRASPHGPGSESTYSQNSVDNVHKMAAQTYLASDTVPAYMVHGTGDEQVSPCNTVEVYEAAKTMGIDVNVTYVNGGGHGCATRGPVWWNGCTNCHGPDPDVLQVMLAFFQRNLQGVDPPTPPSPVPAPTPNPVPVPLPVPRPSPGPAPSPSPGVSEACEGCLVQGCPQLKDTGSSACYTCVDGVKRSCAATCYSASYTFDQLKSWYCDAKVVQV